MGILRFFTCSEIKFDLYTCQGSILYYIELSMVLFTIVSNNHGNVR